MNFSDPLRISHVRLADIKIFHGAIIADGYVLSRRVIQLTPNAQFYSFELTDNNLAPKKVLEQSFITVPLRNRTELIRKEFPYLRLGNLGADSYTKCAGIDNWIS